MWGERAGVPVIKRDRGSDPASVCYDVLDQADKLVATSFSLTRRSFAFEPELMRELAKVVKVTRKRAEACSSGPMPVHVVLDNRFRYRQNGLSQAQEFNESLGWTVSS